MYQRAETAVTLAGVEACRAYFADCMTDPAGAKALWVAHVNDQARCIHLASYPAAAGDLPIRGILAQAALLGSAGVILAQQGSPSPAGMEWTNRLALAAAATDMTVLDHLLFNGDQCSSMRRAGLLQMQLSAGRPHGRPAAVPVAANPRRTSTTPAATSSAPPTRARLIGSRAG